MPSHRSYAVDDRHDAQWDRFPLSWLKLLSEGLELALKVYADKHEINLTLESLRRNRKARENSAAITEPAITEELWKGIAEVGRLRRGLELFLKEPKFQTRTDWPLAQKIRDSLEIAEKKLAKPSILMTAWVLFDIEESSIAKWEAVDGTSGQTSNGRDSSSHCFKFQMRIVFVQDLRGPTILEVRFRQFVDLLTAWLTRPR